MCRGESSFTLVFLQPRPAKRRNAPTGWTKPKAAVRRSYIPARSAAEIPLPPRGGGLGRGGTVSKKNDEPQFIPRRGELCSPVCLPARVRKQASERVSPLRRSLVRLSDFLRPSPPLPRPSPARGEGRFFAARSRRRNEPVDFRGHFFVSPGVTVKKQGRMMIRPYTVAGRFPAHARQNATKYPSLFSVSLSLPPARRARAGCG
jgi:hypothetical protein